MVGAVVPGDVKSNFRLTFVRRPSILFRLLWALFSFIDCVVSQVTFLHNHQHTGGNRGLAMIMLLITFVRTIVVAVRIREVARPFFLLVGAISASIFLGTTVSMDV
jgi:hypothetical protein